MGDILYSNVISQIINLYHYGGDMAHYKQVPDNVVAVIEKYVARGVSFKTACAACQLTLPQASWVAHRMAERIVDKQQEHGTSDG